MGQRYRIVILPEASADLRGIYYHVVERNSAVEIMTIRHGARRQPRRFR